MDKKIVIVLLTVPFLLGWHWFEPVAKKNQRGIRSYENQKFEQALEEFLAARGIKPDNAALRNNTAAALYQIKKYKEALEEFSSIDPKKSGIPEADFHYNVGNSFFRLNQFDKALEHFKKSLLSNPQDMDSKINFELTQKKLEEQKQQKKQDKHDQQQNQKKEEQDKEKEKQQDQQQQKQDQQKQTPQQKHQNLMRYLNQNEKKQLEKKKRAIGIAKKEKDW